MPILSRHLDEDDEPILPQRQSAEREMTLGTGAILGIFFGLVLLLGAFFGFGYKLGSSTARSAVPAGSGDVTASGPSPSTNFSGYKPAAGSPASGTPTVVVHQGGPPALTAPTGASPRSTPVPASPVAAQTADATTAAAPLSLARGGTPAATPVPATPPAMPAASPSGSFIVQVAAVSHQEDADLLVNALHARGYSVAARSEPGDRLVHIQVGPFSNKKDADVMKARLTADGYNAYIK